VTHFRASSDKARGEGSEKSKFTAIQVNTSDFGAHNFCQKRRRRAFEERVRRQVTANDEAALALRFKVPASYQFAHNFKCAASREIPNSCKSAE
jgi:hypothetical protein